MTLNKIKAGLASLAIAGAVALPLSAQAADPVGTSYGTFSGGVAFTTDYRFRGVSQTDTDPAIQGNIDWAYDMFYAGIWGSNIDFNGTTNESMELDLYAGVTTEFQGIGVDIGAIYYYYPNSNAPSNGDFNYWEGKIGLSHDLDVASVGLTYYYSPDFFGEVGKAHYIEGSITVPLFDRLEASAALGHQAFDRSGNIDYTTWNIGVSYAVTDKVSVDVRYVDTDLNTAECAGSRENCSETIIGTLSASF